MTSGLNSRLKRLESQTLAAACVCADRPDCAVTYEDPRDWELRGAGRTISREVEEGKRNFACATHGVVGAKVNIVLRSLASVTEGRV